MAKGATGPEAAMWARSFTVIAWLWARTVKSPNPAFAQVDVPLASTFMLSTKAGQGGVRRAVIEGRRLPLHGEGGQAEGRRGGEERHQARAGQLCLPDVRNAHRGRLGARAWPGRAWAQGAKPC
jgi:adenine-specific DNA methylase